MQNTRLLITFFALKKIEEPGFMEELEKNYGIYVKVDEFVKELKQKLNEIKTYKSLYEYIGTDLGKDKTELEIIVEGYQRAKENRYIRDPNEQIKINQPNISHQYGYESGRRGRGRGRAARYGYGGYRNGYGNRYGDGGW